MRAIAVVPLRDLHTGKSRLRGEFSDVFVRKLIIVMAQRVINALAELTWFEKILIISPDREILQYSWNTQCHMLQQQSLGLNDAIQQVCDSMQGFDVTDLCVIHADLPMVTSAVLKNAFLPEMESEAQFSAAISPDRQHRGTTCLWLRPPHALSPEFGSNSFTLHVSQARRKGIPAKIIHLPELAFDLDTPADISEMQSQFPEIWHDIIENILHDTRTTH